MSNFNLLHVSAESWSRCQELSRRQSSSYTLPTPLFILGKWHFRTCSHASLALELCCFVHWEGLAGDQREGRQWLQIICPLLTPTELNVTLDIFLHGGHCTSLAPEAELRVCLLAWSAPECLSLANFLSLILSHP